MHIGLPFHPERQARSPLFHERKESAMYRLLIIDDPQSCENVKKLLHWAEMPDTCK